MLKTHKFARKPFYVDAVRVSENNIAEVAEWCKGTIKTTEEGAQFIEVEVYRPINDRQTQAHIGDWVLYAGNGFKVYTPKAFDKSFERVKTLTKDQADAAGIKVPHEPRPKSRAIPRKPTNPVLSKENAEKLRAMVPQEPAPLEEKAAEAQIVASVLSEPPADQQVTVIDDGHIHSMSIVAEEPNPGAGVHSIEVKQQEEADKLIEEVLRESK
jgi:hypothetical protein